MAPSTKKGRLSKRSDSNLCPSKENLAKPSYAAKRKSGLNYPFKLPHEDSFIAILKKNAHDLTIDVTSNDDLLLSFKATKRDLGILHAAKNQLLLPYTQSGNRRQFSLKIGSRAGVHKVKMVGLKHYHHNFSSSLLKGTSSLILSEPNKYLRDTACREKEAICESRDFSAGASKDYVAIYSKGQILPERATHEFDDASFSSDEPESLYLNSDEDYIVMSSSYSDRRRRMNTTTVRRPMGKSRLPH